MEPELKILGRNHDWPNTLGDHGNLFEWLLDCPLPPLYGICDPLKSPKGVIQANSELPCPVEEDMALSPENSMYQACQIDIHLRFNF